MSLALILIPLIAALAIFFGAPARLSALIAAVINLGLGVYAAIAPNCDCWDFSLVVMDKPAITLGLGLIDGMSVVMVLLSVIVTLAAVLSGKAPEGREKLYFSSSLLIAAGALGAFLSTDLFFFYAFHELALIPTFLMIGMLGRGDRKAIAWKVTIYLALGSIVLLAGLIWLVAAAGGSYSFEALAAAAPGVPADTQTGIAVLLLIGFGTLISLFPFHSWAAPAYASAPAPTAMLHAGVLKKFGLYGLLRVGSEFLPAGMQALVPWLVVLLLGNILWVGLVTINQRRIDLMLGYSSVMHMGYIFLAIAALAASGGANELAKPAAVILMFAHGVSIALLFGLADSIDRRTQTLQFEELGGMAKPAPALAFLFGLGIMASIGLPGLANFSGELLVFLSGFADYDPAEGFGIIQIATILALWGVVISAVYGLRAFRHSFQGPTVPSTEAVSDMHWCERIAPVFLAAVLLAVGVYPNLLLNLLK